MYADDTVIYFSSSNTGDIEETLQNDLDRVAQWMISCRLVLNEVKTKVIFLEQNKNLVFLVTLTSNYMANKLKECQSLVIWA